MNEVTRAHVFEVVKRAIADVLSDVAPEVIKPEASLRDIGANSLDRMEVVSLSMQSLALHFPVRELSSVSSVDDLVDALHRKLSR
jgi:polyketide biosynthesis acyl carrier protein